MREASFTHSILLKMLYGEIQGVTKLISRIVQGTVMVSSERLNYSFGLLDGLFELGCNAFDTAYIYGNGDNERTVGKWIRDRGIRDKVVVIGKGAHPAEGRNKVTPEDITSDLTGSLERFGFDSIDLYLLHRDAPLIPVDEIVDVLNEHKNAGRIDAFGGSNWTHERLQAANEYAERNNLTQFAAGSPQFGLAYPCKPVWEGCVTIGGPENEAAVNWYRRSALALVPWSSLGAGFFSGRFTPENLNTFEDYFGKLCAECYGHEENFKRLKRAQELGRKKSATPAQIALAWVFSQSLDVFPLVGCASREEFAENVKALDIKLTKEEARYLETG